MLALETRAAAREALQSLSVCPAKGSICLEAKLGAGTIDSNIVQERRVDHAAASGPTPIRQRIPIEGRLKNNARAAYTLLVDTYDDGHSSLHLGAVAFLGRSAANRPIILTDRGSLEITSPQIDVSYGAEFMVADETAWRFKGPYLDLASAVPTVTSLLDIGVWRPEQNQCIALPARKPGRLKVRPGGCAGRHGKGVFGHAEPAAISIANMRKLIDYTHIGQETDENKLDVLSTEFGGEGAYYFVYRIPGTHILIVTASYDDC